MVSLLVDAALRVSDETGLKRIALSGGVFQNAYLFENVVSALTERGFEVYSHVEVPANDAGDDVGLVVASRKPTPDVQRDGDD